jgi:5'-methylthioadenosine phosphorylase
MWAMKHLGVKHVIGPCAAGSLQSHVAPGSFVLCDQFVDRTCGRADTYYEGPIVTHISAAEPYCPQLRELAYKAGQELGIQIHPQGTMVVIQGPRFSTRAESRWFQAQGWEVINMTGYPEAILARELEMCYVNVSLITDYDNGVPGHEAPVSHEEVLHTFAANNEKVKQLILKLIERIPVEGDCTCHHALSTAR